MASGLTFTNASEFERELRRAGEKVGAAASAALYREAVSIMADSVPLVPWDTGTLRGSQTVSRPQREGDDIVVEFGYGGAASAYAEVQHEREDFRHPRGGQAHYLSEPTYLHGAGLDSRMAGHVRWFLSRQGIR